MPASLSYLISAVNYPWAHLVLFTFYTVFSLYYYSTAQPPCPSAAESLRLAARALELRAGPETRQNKTWDSDRSVRCSSAKISPLIQRPLQALPLRLAAPHLGRLYLKPPAQYLCITPAWSTPLILGAVLVLAGSTPSEQVCSQSTHLVHPRYRHGWHSRTSSCRYLHLHLQASKSTHNRCLVLSSPHLFFPAKSCTAAFLQPRSQHPLTADRPQSRRGWPFLFFACHRTPGSTRIPDFSGPAGDFIRRRNPLPPLNASSVLLIFSPLAG